MPWIPSSRSSVLVIEVGRRSWIIQGGRVGHAGNHRFELISQFRSTETIWKKVVTFKSWQKTLLVIAIESDCCGKDEFNNLMFLSDRLCLEVRPSLFLFWGVLAFPAPETLNLDLDTLTEGLVCWLKLGVSGLTMKPDRSGELGNMGIFPEREARMVTWKGKRNTKCIDNQNVQTKGLQ